MHKRVPEPVGIHIVCHEIGRRLRLCSAIPHADARAGQLEHRDVDLCIAESDGIFCRGSEMVQEHLHRLGLRDVLDAEVAKERCLARPRCLP